MRISTARLLTLGKGRQRRLGEAMGMVMMAKARASQQPRKLRRGNQAILAIGMLKTGSRRSGNDNKLHMNPMTRTNRMTRSRLPVKVKIPYGMTSKTKQRGSHSVAQATFRRKQN